MSQLSEDEEEAPEQFPEDHFGSDDEFYDSEFGSAIHDHLPVSNIHGLGCGDELLAYNDKPQMGIHNLTTITEESAFPHSEQGCKENFAEMSWKQGNHCLSMFAEDERRVEEENRFRLPNEIPPEWLKKQHSWEPSIITTPPLYRQYDTSLNLECSVKDVVDKDKENFTADKENKETDNGNLAAQEKITLEETIVSVHGPAWSTPKHPGPSHFDCTISTIGGDCRDASSFYRHKIGRIRKNSMFRKEQQQPQQFRFSNAHFSEHMSKLTMKKHPSDTLSTTAIDRALSDSDVQSVASDDSFVQRKLMKKILNAHVISNNNRRHQEPIVNEKYKLNGLLGVSANMAKVLDSSQHKRKMKMIESLGSTAAASTSQYKTKERVGYVQMQKMGGLSDTMSSTAIGRALNHEVSIVSNSSQVQKKLVGNILHQYELQKKLRAEQNFYIRPSSGVDPSSLKKLAEMRDQLAGQLKANERRKKLKYITGSLI